MIPPTKKAPPHKETFMFDFFQPLDESIQTAIQSGWHNTFIDLIMKFFSIINDHGELWIGISGLLLIFKKTRKCGICMAICLAIEVVLCNKILKPIFDRPRPYNVLIQFEPLLPRLKSFSFPSGHTMSSFSAATALFISEAIYLSSEDKKNFFIRHRKGLIAFLIAAIIGFSRIYLFMHWPSDIVIGALLGIIQAVICAFVFIYFEKKITASLSKKESNTVTKT